MAYMYNKYTDIHTHTKVLDCKSLKNLYFSLFYPHIDYCCEVWGNTYKINIHSLFLLQKTNHSHDTVNILLNLMYY